MSIFDNFSTIKSKKLINYLKVVDHTTLSAEQLLNLMFALIDSLEYARVKTIADWIILNGLPFDRASIVPVGVIYSTGEVPVHKLKFVEILYKLYKYYGTASYNTEAQSILTRLISYNIVASGNYQTTPLSTDVLLYDLSGNLVPNFRSGTHISDIYSSAWILNNYETHANNQIEFVDDSFDYSYNNYTFGTFSTPFYVRDLVENVSYGTYNTFVFTGTLGDELDFSHQYDILLNTSKYQYEYFLKYGEVNPKAKVITENLMSYLSSYSTTFPLSLIFKPITLGSSNIYLSNYLVTLATLGFYNIVLGDIGIGNLSKIGLSCLYDWILYKNETSLTQCRAIVLIIEGLQASNGSITETIINYSNQALCLSLLTSYNALNKKSYYQIINEALKTYDLNEINDSNYATHPQRFILEQCNECMDQILNSKFFELTETNTPLVYSAGLNNYLASTYEIDLKRIHKIEYVLGNSLYELNYITLEAYNEFIIGNPVLNLPQYYTLNENTNEILIYPKPNQDYSIYANHYKCENKIINFNKIPSMVYEYWYPVIKYFICWKIGISLTHSLSEYFKNK